MSEKICYNYCGYVCVNGFCPLALYHEDSTLFEKKPSCDDCIYYKGCDDCCFKGTDMCEDTRGEKI